MAILTLVELLSMSATGESWYSIMVKAYEANLIPNGISSTAFQLLDELVYVYANC